MTLRGRKGELAMAVAVLILGIATFAGSFSYAYATEFGPDAGFFPFWLGLAETVVGATLVWATLTGADIVDSGRPIGTRRQIGAAALFIAYVTALGPLGFGLATLVFLFAVLAFVESRTWLVAALYSAGTTAALVMLFQWAFRLPLPTGYF